MMTSIVKNAAVALVPVIALLLSGSPARAEGAAETARDPQSSAASVGVALPAFELPMPAAESERRYLSLPGTGTFRVEKLEAKVLIIEMFSFYCPHCQRAAPQMNELHAEIEGRPDLKGKVKLIGIGVGNTPYEINEFRTTYNVPFPLFPDPDKEISERLKIRFTPTFIGVNLKEGGTAEQFYFEAGRFEDASKFLAEVVKLSQLK